VTTEGLAEIPGVPVTAEPLPLPSPEEPASRPEVHLTPRQWARQNLFPTPFAALLTVVFGVALAYAAYRLARFVLVSSDWEIVRRNLRRFMIETYPVDEVWRLWVSLYLVAGLAGLFGGATVARAEERAVAEGRTVAPPGRWAWVQRYWPALLAVGVVLSQTRTWTPTLLTLVVAAVIVVTRWIGRRLAVLARFTWLALLLGVVAVVMLTAGPGGVSWDDWGGLQLTAFVTVAGIALSFPLGVLLALARRASVPPVRPVVPVAVTVLFAGIGVVLVALVRWGPLALDDGVRWGALVAVAGLVVAAILGRAVRLMAVGTIELVRAVPLVTLLFMGEFVVRLFFPNTVDPPGDLSRALIAITIFEAAYVAETVRGGLQSIPRGQFEAAQAIGLSPWKTTRRVVLPQALQAVIPPTVGQFISLFKDTTLLQIIGFTELLEAAEDAGSQPEFLAQGLHTVTFAFAALIYWAGSYTMSRESRRIERRLGLGGRAR
jgi:general L-amino acid transport system permease protein